MAFLRIKGQRPNYRDGFIMEELKYRHVVPGEMIEMDDSMIDRMIEKYGDCVERQEKQRRPPISKNKMVTTTPVVKEEPTPEVTEMTEEG